MWVQFYTPADNLTPTPANPHPLNGVRKVADSYQEQNPKVKISFVTSPANQNQRVWTETVQAGGTAPDIMWQHSFQIDDDVKKGWWIPLDSYMEQPNPYIKSGDGSQHWIDEFYPTPTGSKKSIDGHLYVVPFDLVTTFFFYNKDAYSKAGVNAPTTWAEWFDAQKKLKDSGIIPNMKPGWSDSQVEQMIFANLDDKIHPGGGSVPRKDVECAIANKVWDFGTPQGKDYLTVLKNMTPYFTSDWAATGTTADYFPRKFSTGQVATFEDGTWRMGALKYDPLLKFQWGTFFCPTLTTDTAPTATGQPANPIGGATAAQWAITSRAQKEGRLDLAVDVLHYFSAPENASVFIGEADSFLPNIKGVNVSADLADPLKRITTGYGETAMFVYGDKQSQETGTKVGTITTNLRLGKISVEDAQKQVQQTQLDGAKEDISKLGWSC
jgi:ABC-type glycerol-3-phosphate transport system substrate-binding protein